MSGAGVESERRGGIFAGMRPLLSRYVLVRCGAVLLVLVAVFAAAGAAILAVERQLEREHVAAERQRVVRWVDDVLEAGGTPLRLFVESYARRTSFTRPERESAGASPETTLASGMRTHRLAAAWVVEADGTVRIGAGAADGELPLPITPAQLAAQRTRAVRFYLRSGEALFEVRGARLSGTQQTADRRGWLFGAVRVDRDGLLAPLTRTGEEVAILTPREANVLRAMEPGTFRVDRELKDLAGMPVGVLRLERRPPGAEANARTFRTGLTVMAGMAALSIAVLGAGLAYWLVAPARRIHLALLRQDADAIRPLLGAGGEIGRLAQAASAAIERQLRLERSLAERERLARELHDGVVQSLYAAGLGLAAAQEKMAARPDEARRVLEDTRTTLNDTIRELRGVIAGLEPEELQHRSFAEAAQTVAAFMQAVRAVKFSVEIDQPLAARLSPPERMHLLQVVREAVSNAVRHGQAERVTITLRAEAEGAVLEVADDGCGFETGAAQGEGRGLANFNARAREIGGAVTVESDRERGTVLRLVLPRLAGTGHR